MRPNPSTALAEVVVDELVRNGIELFVISPGSRSGALAIAAAGHPGARTVIVVDERSAAFRALGSSKAGRGAAVVATSGTAVANWFPAVIEADSSATPLVLLSADRPAELRGVGANQTIDQVGLFGDNARLALDIPAPDGADQNSWWRESVCRAVAVSRGAGGSPGPVQINIGFREPTVPVSNDGRTSAEPYPHSIEGRSGTGPWIEVPAGHAAHADVTIGPASRGVIIAGEGHYDRELLAAEARRLGWPVLATAASGMRGPGVVDAYHHILSGPLPPRLAPAVVVAIGAIGPSDRLEDIVAAAGERVRIDFWGRRFDPRRNATLSLAADPVEVLAGIDPRPDPGWQAEWQSAQETVRTALVAALDDWGTGAATVAAAGRTGLECLVAASSLPIREVDAHLSRDIRVIGNRGASGIDGIVSTAFGVSEVIDRTVLLTGDLSLFHDSNGFLSEEGTGLVTVVIDNGGGGLFDSLPTAAHAPSYERLFVAATGRRIADLAAFHRVDHHLARSADDLKAVVDQGLEERARLLVEVRVDRAEDAAARRRLDEIARSALQA